MTSASRPGEADPESSGLLRGTSGNEQAMRLLTALRESDRVGTQQAAHRIPPGVGKALSVVEEAAESTKL
jgi:hypothetical protein